MNRSSMNVLRKSLALWIYPQLAQDIHDAAVAHAPSVLLSDTYQCDFYGDVPVRSESALPADWHKEYLAWAKGLSASRFYVHIIKWIIDTQANHALRFAKTERAIDFARATINATEIFKKEVERLAFLHDNPSGAEEEEEFDKFNTGINENL